MVDFSRQQIVNRRVSPHCQATYFEIVRWVMAGALIVGLILAYCWNHMTILDIQFQLEALKLQNTQLVENNFALRAEYFSLKNPQRISSQAQQMGMIGSNQPQIRIIQSDGPTRPPDALVAAARDARPVMNE